MSRDFQQQGEPDHDAIKFAFDEGKVKRDGGKFSKQAGAGKSESGGPANAGLPWKDNAQNHINAIVDAGTPKDREAAHHAAIESVLDTGIPNGNKAVILRKLAALRHKQDV